MRRMILALALALPLFGAAGDITAVRIIKDTCTAGASCNGWVAEIDISQGGGATPATGGTYSLGLGAGNNPSTAKIVFTVTSPGYDTSGNVTTITRTVYGAYQLRKPAPDQATMDEAVSGGTLTVRLALSDYVYVGDTATVTIIAPSGVGFYNQGGVQAGTCTDLAVTNNSTQAYPKPIGRWAWPGWERVTGSSYLLEAVAFHRSARNGKPLAALKFSCTDGSATVTATVNDMTVSTRTGDANKVLVYAATINPTTLAQGAMTCNFTAYPWVGNAPLSSDLVANGGDGFAQPDERLGPLSLIHDTGTYGTAFAVVDSTNGAAATAVNCRTGIPCVFSTQVAAEAAYAGNNTYSYSTMAYAIQALKNYNNANYSRNEAGGGTVLLATNSNAWPGTGVASCGTPVTWVTITRLSTVAQSGAVISSGTNASLQCGMLKLYDITLAGNSTGQIKGTTSAVLWVDNTTINMTGTSPIYTWQLAHATHNSITALANGFQYYSTAKAPYGLVRGNTGPVQSSTGAGIAAGFYNVLGNINIRPVFVPAANAYSQQISDNAIAAYNTSYNMNATWLAGSGTTSLPSGVAVVQNVIEETANSLTAPIWLMDMDGTGLTTNHMIYWHNTTMGGRINLNYNWAVNSAVYHWNDSFVGNLWNDYNCKTDTYATANGARVGNWATSFAVGQRANQKFASVGAAWGDFDGLYTARAGTIAFVADASASYDSSGGSGLGNGDYHLTAFSSALSLVPSSRAVLPFDLVGVARKNDGTGAAGAYEYQPPASGRRRPVWVIQ